MKFLKRLYWRLFIIRLSLRWITQLNLGDRVRYMGRDWTLSQGVKAPIWRLFDGKLSKEVHESKFQKVWSVKGCWQSFRFGYRFYRWNWFEIWVREGIKPWMLSSNIWAGKPPRVHDEQGAT